MKNQELTERYIYSVTRYLKKNEREDIAKELESIIEDMLEEQYGGKEPNEYQMKALLSELGTPLELYEKYSQDGSDCLIGAPYFGTYKYIMKIVAVCIVFGMFVASCITFITEQQVWYEALASILANIFGGLLSGFAVVTLLFAYFYKKQIKIDGVLNSLDNLPEIPKKETGISKTESILGIIASVLFAILFLACPQIICTVNAVTGEVVPIFNVSYIQDTWYVIVLFAALGIGTEIMKLVEGHYTKRLLLVTAVEDGISAVLVIFWLINDSIVNPVFFTSISDIFTNGEAWLNNMMSHFNLFFMAVILFALALDFGTTLIKTEKQ